MFQSILTSKKASILLAFMLLLSTASLSSQEVFTLAEAGKKAEKNFKKARAYGNQRNLDAALQTIEKVLKKYPGFVDAYAFKGAVHYDRKEYEKAEQALRKTLELKNDYNDLLYFQLALTQWQLQAFDNCVVNLEKYLTTDIGRPRQRKIAEKYLQNARFAAQAVKNPLPYDPQPLSDNINTRTAMEALPSTTADGELMLYVKRINRQEDLYVSTFENGEWQEGQPIKGFDSPGLNEGAPALSADGRTLVYTVCNKRGDFGSCDLYIAEKIDSLRWSRPQNMGATINTGSWESQPTLSADGNRLIFSSDRSGSLGKRDLWYSSRQANGQWSRPRNLGDSINTAENEESPFLHPDEQTLYFMSDGHPGMGGFDLFLSRKNDKFEWSAPQNLGYPINSQENEGGLSLSLDGKTAYYTQGLEGDNDIYTFEFPASLRPQPVTFVKALVYDAVSQNPVTATAEIFNLTENQLFIKKNTLRDGTFLICLPIGKEYALTVEKKGYVFYSDYFSATDATRQNEPFLLEIPLLPLKEPARKPAEPTPIVLNNIFFETGSSSLLPTSQNELNRLYDLLVANPSMVIQINGHTDNVGQPEDNQKLSEERAKAVYQYLSSKGIDEKRLSYKGFGESRPIAENDSLEGRRKNRRTEFVIISQ